MPASVSSDVLGPNSNTVSAEDTSVTSLGGCCVAHPANKLKPKPIANTFKTNRFAGNSNGVEHSEASKGELHCRKYPSISASDPTGGHCRYLRRTIDCVS